MTRDEDADEEEVARGRDKDRRSDVATRRLVSPGVSKRPARFSRSAKAVKLAECEIPEVESIRNQSGARRRSKLQRGDMLIRLVETTTTSETHIWQRRASRRYVTRKKKTPKRRLKLRREIHEAKHATNLRQTIKRWLRTTNEPRLWEIKVLIAEIWLTYFVKNLFAVTISLYSGISHWADICIDGFT